MKLTNKFQKIAASFSLLFFLNLFVFIQSAHTTRYTCGANVRCHTGSYNYLQCWGTSNCHYGHDERGGYVTCNGEIKHCDEY